MSFQRITDRDELIQYIVKNKSKSARLRDLTDDDVLAWAKSQETEFIKTVASGIWKDAMNAFRI